MKHALARVTGLSFGVAVVAGCGAAGNTSSSSASTASTVPAQLQSVYKAAKAEGGGLTLYTQMPSTQAATLQSMWDKEFPGVPLQYVRFTTPLLEARVEAEISSGKPTGDVVQVADEVWTDGLYAKGSIAQSSSPYYSVWPAAYKKTGYYFADEVYLSAIMYNTNEVTGSEIPTTPQDVLKLGPKASVASPAGGGGDATVVYGTMEQFGASFWQAAKNAGVRYDLSEDTDEPLVVSGALEAAYTTNNLAACDQAAGRPIKVIYPTEGTYATPAYEFVLKNDPHPKAAQLFIDYTMSPAGQSFLNSSSCTYSVEPGVTLSSALPPFSSLHVLFVSPADWAKNGAAYTAAATAAAGVPTTSG